MQQLSRSVEPALGEGFDDYETFRKVLYRYHRRHLLSVWSGYPFSIALPFSLLRLIEIEISDLRAITEGVAFGLAGSEIIAMTVGG
jgi:vacuolar-type H+-ATPase subunit C/Vma6